MEGDEEKWKGGCKGGDKKRRMEWTERSYFRLKDEVKEGRQE